MAHTKMMQKKPKINEKHIKEQLDFGRREHWNICEWERVVFSNETKVNQIFYDGHIWCGIRDG
jgi:hypothetical protein